MYRVTYVIGTLDRNERAAAVGKILRTLTRVDVDFLRAHPEALSIKDSGVKEIPEPRDLDEWHDIPTLLRTKKATRPELDCWRAAESFIRGGKQPLQVPLLRTIDPEQGRFVLGTDLFHGDDERELSHRVLAHMLVGLTEIDEMLLRNHPEWPDLYDSGVYYEEEPPGQEDWQDAPTCMQLGASDCFPEGTLLLRDDFTIQKIEDICVGDRIWGRKDWTTVEAVVEKGNLSVDVATLNNGSHVTLTGDHHFFVARCPEHEHWHSTRGYGCDCPLEGRRIDKVRLRELQPKDVLVQPDKLPFGRDDSLSPEVSYVEGLYVSDGWHSSSNFCISGQDGCPKEAQKHEVKRICDNLGISTGWHRKSIRVNDRKWADRMALMGCHAPEKHLLSIDLAEAQARQALRGVMADSKINDSSGWTFTTTSHELMVQTRVLQKMFGRSSSVMYVVNHGGLGKNPIWRLGVREPRDKAAKLLRFKSREQDVFEAPCYDIQTSDHYVYLPEHDVTVSNCEDLACWRAAELRVRYNIAARPSFLWRRKPTGSYLYHIQVKHPDGRTEDPSRRLGMR